MNTTSASIGNRTSATLLNRLQTVSDRQAWNAFHDRYWRLIVGFARQRGCTDAMAWDVLQETMLILMQSLRRFDYDPARGKFRSFLLKIVDRQVMNAHRRERKYRRLSDSEAEQLLADSAGGRHDEDRVSLWEREWEANLLARALDNVRRRILSTTYDSFRLYALEGRSAAEVEAVLGINRNTIYQNRNRVLSLLRREIKVLEEELDP